MRMSMHLGVRAARLRRRERGLALAMALAGLLTSIASSREDSWSIGWVGHAQATEAPRAASATRPAAAASKKSAWLTLRGKLSEWRMRYHLARMRQEKATTEGFKKHAAKVLDVANKAMDARRLTESEVVAIVAKRYADAKVSRELEALAKGIGAQTFQGSPLDAEGAAKLADRLEGGDPLGRGLSFLMEVTARVGSRVQPDEGPALTEPLRIADGLAGFLRAALGDYTGDYATDSLLTPPASSEGTGATFPAVYSEVSGRTTWAAPAIVAALFYLRPLVKQPTAAEVGLPVLVERVLKKWTDTRGSEDRNPFLPSTQAVIAALEDAITKLPVVAAAASGGSRSGAPDAKALPVAAANAARDIVPSLGDLEALTNYAHKIEQGHPDLFTAETAPLVHRAQEGKWQSDRGDWARALREALANWSGAGVDEQKPVRQAFAEAVRARLPAEDVSN